MALLAQLLANGCVAAAISAALACSFGVAYRCCRVFHIALAAVFLTAPYATFWAVEQGIPVAPAVIFGVTAGTICSLGAEFIIYRPLFRRRASAAAVLVASLGLTMIIQNLLAVAFGNDHKSVGTVDVSTVRFGAVSLTSLQILQFVICGALVTAFGVAVRRIGALRALWAMGEEPELIQSLGLPLTRFRMLVFMMSGLVASLTGCMVGLDIGIDTNMGLPYLLIAVVAVFVGGVDRFEGWVCGALLLSLLRSVALWKFDDRWSSLVMFAVMSVVLVIRPQGIAGIRRRLEER